MTELFIFCIIFQKDKFVTLIFQIKSFRKCIEIENGEYVI